MSLGDATYCSGNVIRRLLTCDSARATAVAHAQVPAAHATMVIVNSTLYGGSGGPVATFSTAPGAAEIALHEMGHTAFGFADEYEYYAGCGSGETCAMWLAGGAEVTGVDVSAAMLAVAAARTADRATLVEADASPVRAVLR